MKILLIGLTLALIFGLLHKLYRRLQLSAAKHPSLTGHVRWSKRIASWIPYYEYTESQFFCTDHAPLDIVERRQAGFDRLAAHYQSRFAQSLAATATARGSISDLQFTSRYRVPFQFSRYLRERLPVGGFVQSSAGVTLTDLDGNVFHDLTGSYGVNVFGNDFYKECMAQGAAQVRDLGPVLGSYHPVMLYNVKRLRQISALDEISFHMSGTEAVMQAVRLAQYHTERKYLVRFSGAYHGWWGDVQPGIGNPIAAPNTYTLREMHAATLRVLNSRRDIACVLVNPLQALHPNQSAPGDSALIDGSRKAGFDKAAYTQWLHELRAVCSARNIVLIFDEVFVGFRLALGGAQEYFGVRADMVIYGKTVAGGFPIGVVCGRADLMQRFRADRPANICFARGTFNSHPYVMGAMHEFLLRLESPAIRRVYQGVNAIWNARAAHLNERLQAAQIPIRVDNLSSIWTLSYLQPSRYHWMFQFYLRAAGLALSWVGTGRLIFSLNYTDADFGQVAEKFISAGEAMQADGWWWHGTLTRKAMKRQVLSELIQARTHTHGINKFTAH